jgi:hypothetical protein
MSKQWIDDHRKLLADGYSVDAINISTEGDERYLVDVIVYGDFVAMVIPELIEYICKRYNVKVYGHGAHHEKGYYGIRYAITDVEVKADGK